MLTQATVERDSVQRWWRFGPVAQSILIPTRPKPGLANSKMRRSLIGGRGIGDLYLLLVVRPASTRIELKQESAHMHWALQR